MEDVGGRLVEFRRREGVASRWAALDDISVLADVVVTDTFQTHSRGDGSLAGAGRIERPVTML